LLQKYLAKMESIKMTEAFTSIITELERQKTVIDNALAALRDVDGMKSPAPEVTVKAAPATNVPATRKGRMSPEGKKRLIAALKKRWAAKKTAGSAQPVSAPVAAPKKPAPPAGGMTEDGRRRLAEAMKRRWAVKRAASAVKKTGRKQRGTKKAA
jgi:hypothetical protein